MINCEESSEKISGAHPHPCSKQVFGFEWIALKGPTEHIQREGSSIAIDCPEAGFGEQHREAMAQFMVPALLL